MTGDEHDFSKSLNAAARDMIEDLPDQYTPQRDSSKRAARRGVFRALFSRTPKRAWGVASPASPSSMQHGCGTSAIQQPSSLRYDNEFPPQIIGRPVARNSQHGILSSRPHTWPVLPGDARSEPSNGCSTERPKHVYKSLSKSDGVVTRLDGPVSVLIDSRYPKPIMQPEPASCPVSQEQLAAEVKGIYGGLVMVEAKCINTDAAQPEDRSSSFGSEQWQALIALHRTLLYEHHDFLMATQHPSATLALPGLAQKYSMPARMWRHAIHAFLEVLRHRRPGSQDYMLAFIYLAYQMMALLFETVPAFRDTWIECLGDLSRYRLAVEEEKGTHSIWESCAARWHDMAPMTRHPAVGRLRHHLTILERQPCREMFLYAKSLTCVIPSRWFETTSIDRQPSIGRLHHHFGIMGRLGDPKTSARMLPSTSMRESTAPLNEDCLIRGLIWCNGCVPASWFRNQSEEDARFFEDSETYRDRVHRVQRLASYLYLRSITNLIQKSCDSLKSKFSKFSDPDISTKKLVKISRCSVRGMTVHLASRLPLTSAQDMAVNSAVSKTAPASNHTSWYLSDPVQHVLSYVWRQTTPLLYIIPIGFGMYKIGNTVLRSKDNLRPSMYMRNLALANAFFIGALQQVYDEVDHAKLIMTLWFLSFFGAYIAASFRMIRADCHNHFISGITLGTIVGSLAIACWTSPVDPAFHMESPTRKTAKFAVDVAPFVATVCTWVLFERYRPERPYPSLLPR